MPSASPPEFFVDRSLGRHIVPDALRAAGAVVHVMADEYGERIGQGLADDERLLALAWELRFRVRHVGAFNGVWC